MKNLNNRESILRGQILDYAVRTNSGVISAENGERFEFVGADWNGNNAPIRGAWVDFKPSNEKAIDIYGALAQGKTNETGPKKPEITLWALFLGGFGAHKFYLGSWGWGIVYLATCWWLFIPFLVAMVETVRYILMTDEEFRIKLGTYQKSPFGFFW